MDVVFFTTTPYSLTRIKTKTAITSAPSSNFEPSKEKHALNTDLPARYLCPGKKTKMSYCLNINVKNV